MEKQRKIVYLKEKSLEKKSAQNCEKFLENQNFQNPIKAMFRAFSETKKDITEKDLF